MGLAQATNLVAVAEPVSVDRDRVSIDTGIRPRLLTLPEAEERADLQALQGLVEIEGIRASCGAGCLDQAGIESFPCGKVNGTATACKERLMNLMMQIRLSAQRAWLKVLTHLGKVNLDGENSEHLPEYAKLFDTLFDHGAVEINDEILALSHSADSQNVDGTTRALYMDAREKLIQYLVAKRLMTGENDFAHNYHELVLFISCFADLEGLEALQSHIVYAQRKETLASASAASSIEAN